MTLSIEYKGNPKNGKKYSQIIYLVRDINPAHIENSRNSTTKEQPDSNMGKGLE